MTDRTFQQYAQGFGSTPCYVVCQIDGNTVFAGTITTLDQPFPSLPDAECIAPLAWSWQDSADFSGTKQFTVSVTGSPLLLAQTLANNPYANVTDPEQFEFASFYEQEIDGVIYPDPFTNETIDGAIQSGPFTATYPGQWWWKIPAGSTFAATLHINAADQNDAIEFVNTPSTMTPGSTETFEVLLTEEDRPYPRTFTWQIINGSSTDADFDSVSGSVVFNSANSSFNISTVAHDPVQGPKDFKVSMINSSGSRCAESSTINIS